MSDRIAQVTALPIYRQGFGAGVDVGLRLALDALTLERIYQEQLATDPDSRSAACREYTNARLLAVAKVIADRFRQ